MRLSKLWWIISKNKESNLIDCVYSWRVCHNFGSPSCLFVYIICPFRPLLLLSASVHISSGMLCWFSLPTFPFRICPLFGAVSPNNPLRSAFPFLYPPRLADWKCRLVSSSLPSVAKSEVAFSPQKPLQKVYYI